MPELAGFILFIRNTMGVNADALADDDPAVSLSWSMSLDWVNRQIACISPVLYSQAVYNLAASFLLNFGPEVAFGPVREKLGTTILLLALSAPLPMNQPVRRGLSVMH